MKEYLDIGVPAIVSIIGFIVTYLLMKREFRNSIGISLYNDRKKLYIETYSFFVKVSQKRDIVFQQLFEKELTDIWVKLSIVASQKVFEKSDKIYIWLKRIISEYNDFCKKNDYEKWDEDELGNKIPLFTQEDIDRYKYDEEEFRYEHMPEKGMLDDMIHDLLEAIKIDLKTRK